MKTFIRKDRLSALMFAGFMAVMSGRAANAASLNLSDVPLFLSTGAEPNIMLMFDSSGSMSNIVVAAPYNPATTYNPPNCPVGSTWRVNPFNGANVTTVAMAGTTTISGTVTPIFRLNGSGTNQVLGTASGTPGRKCFDPAGMYLATLNSAASGYSGTMYSGNYLNWYFNATNVPAAGCTNDWTSGRKPCSKTRLMIAKTAGESLVSTMPAGMRVGLSSYNSGTAGKLLSKIELLSSAKRTSLTTSIQGMTSSGATPLAETLNDIGYYFSKGATGNLTLHPGAANQTTKSRDDTFGATHDSSWTAAGVDNPIQYRCQKSFAVLLTDGRPQEDRNISTNIRDYIGDCAAGRCDAASNSSTMPTTAITAANYLTLKNGVQVGRTYETNGSDYLDDVAAALYDMDLRPDIAKDAGQKNNVVTYLIGLADPVLENDPLIQSAADKGGGEKYIAGNESELVAAFQSALASIEAKIGTAASASVNSGSINSDTRLFQAVFDSGSWSGKLLAKSVAKQGETEGIAEGTLGDAIEATIPTPANREIITVNGVGTAADPHDAVAFKWADIDATRKNELLNLGTGPGTDATTARGEARLDYLRGVRTNEGTTGYQFRRRASVLGDIVNSAPAYVGAPAFRYPDTLEDEDKPYSGFRSDNANRAHMVYVGANDGMLHAFESNDSQADGEGAVTEKMAFIPKTVFKNLYKLAAPAYTHQYYADGSPVTGDAFFGGDWHTMLVAGLNKGGQGVYALDITDPTTFTDDNADDIFQWEFTDEQDSDLGYTFSRPSIIRMNNGTWVAAFGNGYNNTVDDDADGTTTNDSTTGNAVLYILNLETGAVISKIDTGVGSAQDPNAATAADRVPNGLSTPVFVDSDGDSDVDLAYAGDLFGNLWKFDLSSDDPADWAVAYDGEPLFTAIKGTTHQPITSRPNVSRGPNGEGLMVVFGTGKYLEQNDTVLAKIPDASFYGLIDKNTGDADEDLIGARTSSLTAQTITSQTATLRTTSANPLGTETNNQGWYLDLESTGSSREMQVTDSLIRNGHVIFTTLIPQTTDACGAGGSSWLMEMNLFNGARATTTPFDLNNNGLFDDTTKVGEDDTPVSGVKTNVGITPKPAPLSGEKCDYLIFPGTSGATETRCRNPGPRGFGRQSWRQAH